MHLPVRAAARGAVRRLTGVRGRARTRGHRARRGLVARAPVASRHRVAGRDVLRAHRRLRRVSQPRSEPCLRHPADRSLHGRHPAQPPRPDVSVRDGDDLCVSRRARGLCAVARERGAPPRGDRRVHPRELGGGGGVSLHAQSELLRGGPPLHRPADLHPQPPTRRRGDAFSQWRPRSHPPADAPRTTSSCARWKRGRPTWWSVPSRISGA